MSGSPNGGSAGSPGALEATAEALLDGFLDVSNQALFSFGRDGRVGSWNRGAERIFGRPANEIIGSTIVALFPDRLRSEVEALTEAACAGERVDRALLEIERKDGMPIPIALSMAGVIGTDGSPAGCVVVVDELTETRLAQAMLAEVEARSRDWEALAHVGRWLWDVGTDSVQWSDELHRLHAVAPLDFAGTLDAHLACLHPGDRDRIRTCMEEAVASGHSFDDVYRVVHPDGDEVLFEVRAEPTLNSSGVVVGLRGVSRGRAGDSAPGGQQANALEQV